MTDSDFRNRSRALVVNGVKGLLRRAGFELRRVQVGGYDPFADCATYLGAARVRTVFDVGANLGQTARQLAPKFPQADIFAFEPTSAVLSELRANVRPYAKVEVLDVALGEADTEAWLSLMTASTGNSLLEKSPEAQRGGDWLEPIGRERVTVMRLDTFCAARRIETIDILKIDTQGFDDRVLRGAGDLLDPKTIKAILVEVNFERYYDRQTYFADIYALLSAKGYRLVDFYHKARHGDLKLRFCDALFF